jgi:hypothetical protein
MYSNFQGEGCNFFFEENEFFGRVATKGAKAGRTMAFPQISNAIKTLP